MNAVKITKPTAVPPLHDDPSVPETYADSFTGVVFNHGNLNLTFAALRADHTVEPPGNFRKVVNRLVLPASVALELHTYLGHIISDLEKQGAVKKAPTLQVIQ